MEKKILGITALLCLFLFILSNQRMICNEDSPTILWKFEPRTDRSVHVEAVVLLTKSTDSYKFLEISEKIWIKNFKAYEYESKDTVEHEIYYDSEIDKQVIMLIFSHPVPEPFTFGIEFDLFDFMEEKKEKVFIFEWLYRSEEEKSHAGEVFLPKGAELLGLKYLEPVRMEEGEQVIIYYEGKSKGHNDFNFQLIFSSSGKEYLELAERYEESGNYDLALSYYQRAKSLYGRYNLISDAKSEILRELYEKITTLQKIHADNSFEKGTEAFEQKEYERAQSQFKEAELLYRILKDTERESECREIITECERILLTKEAERLFKQAKEQYESEDNKKAKESFIQSRDKFEELGDAEKVSECEGWLNKIEEIYQIIFVCIGGAVVISVIQWQRFQEEYKEGSQRYEDFSKTLLVIWCILLLGLGIPFHSIFLEIAVLLVYCFFTAWIGCQYQKYVPELPHSLGGWFRDLLVVCCAVGGIILLGMGIRFLLQSVLSFAVFFVVPFFIVWVSYHSYKKWGAWGFWKLLQKGR